MKILATLCAVVWLLFTCLVLMTDGFPTRIGYILATLLTLLAPLLTLAVLFRRNSGDHPTPRVAVLKGAALVANVAVLAYLAWGLVFLPPHPAEEGYVPYMVLAILTPVVSLVALFLHKPARTAPGETGKADHLAGQPGA